MKEAESGPWYRPTSFGLDSTNDEPSIDNTSLHFALLHFISLYFTPNLRFLQQSGSEPQWHPAQLQWRTSRRARPITRRFKRSTAPQSTYTTQSTILLQAATARELSFALSDMSVSSSSGAWFDMPSTLLSAPSLQLSPVPQSVHLQAVLGS